MPENDYEGALVPGANRELLLEALVSRSVYTLADGEDPTELDATDDTTGARILYITWKDVTFGFVDGDATSEHDGLTVIVTADGGRYHAPGISFPIKTVLDRDIDTPPEDPEFGDAYIVGDAPTGDWADHAEEIAVYTARGWLFKAATTGTLVYVDDEDVFWHVNAAGDWILGSGLVAAAESIPPSAMIGGGGKSRWIVENQTENDPPAVTDGVAYIIGAAPTGDWSGETGKIAHGENGAWVLYTAATGWMAFDKALGNNFIYRGMDGWVNAGGAIINAGMVRRADSDNLSNSGSTTYTFSAGTAPSTQARRLEHANMALEFTATRSGARLKFSYQVNITNITNGNSAPASVALFRDSESNAIDWTRLVAAGTGADIANYVCGHFAVFEVDAADAATHDYTIRFYGFSDGGTFTVARRILTVDEYA